ncbi:MAG TPA: carbohydrate kinase [Cyclobacteriaceae bacterium]|nr:carbohydrate kinase [Cyclobacteriaceae bacterium]
MKEKEQVLCFGETVWDYLPDGRRPGGAPMNVALNLKRFGIKSVFASSVGNDQIGVELLGFIGNTGLSTDLIQVHKQLPTGEVKVKLRANNDASFEICKPVAWDEIDVTPGLVYQLSNSRALVYGSVVARSEHTRESLFKLLETDVIKILDVNLRPPDYDELTVKKLMAKADILKLNDEELIVITNWYGMNGNLEQRMNALQEMFKFDTLIVTRGKDGAYLIHDSTFYQHDGFQVNTIDTVGSGDAFLAGFLAALFAGKNMDIALTEACAIGAFVATQSGATPEYTTAVIQTLIKK